MTRGRELANDTILLCTHPGKTGTMGKILLGRKNHDNFRNYCKMSDIPWRRRNTADSFSCPDGIQKTEIKIGLLSVIFGLKCLYPISIASAASQENCL